ncbi:MAG: SIMPL domain-containing protein [Candidatus Methanoperedens sp.]|nr:SIMPL domain-containing protein [Candidatus Methanoperedens sp.]MCZ7394798.1 SIMPL domain-containing protein [Candidatus Methanoperedens sp.]
MPQETSDRKLYVLLVILSIALVLIAAQFFGFVLVGNSGEKLLNTAASPEQRLISVSGSASTSVIPDTASISLGVLTQAVTAKEASDKNAASMNAVINALKSLGLQDKDIRTSFLSVQPLYNYSSYGGVPTIVGYSASNNVEITTMMLDKLGDILDKSTAAGANQVGGISFVISDEKQRLIRYGLLGDAVKDAQGKANKLADSLGVRIAGVKTASISEVFPPVFSPLPFVSAIAEKAATPIQPGESKLTISVEVTYIIE